MIAPLQRVRQPVRHRVGGDLFGVMDVLGKVVVDGSVMRRASLKNTGGVDIHGTLYGQIETTGPVVIRGDMEKGSTVMNTGGGFVYGRLRGTFDTTGTVFVFGSIDDSARVHGGEVILIPRRDAMELEE